MVKRTVSEADLARLKREREDADRGYNEALTGLDAVRLRDAPEFPHPPPPPDEAVVTPINLQWQVLAARPQLPPGWRGRLAAFVWSVIEPVVTAQQGFNGALVDHLNRNIQPQRETARSIETTIAVLRFAVDRLMAFELHVMAFLQRMTPYIDSKDHEFAALARRIIEDAQTEIERLDRTVRGLAAGLAGVSDDGLKRWESMLTRDQRYDGRIEEVRAGVAVAQQQLVALRREFERVSAGQGVSPANVEPGGGREALPAASTPSSNVKDWQYVGFEDLFRGSRDEIRQRLAGYAPLFDGRANVLDVGCGRGEFLDLLNGRGVSARGIDLNHEMVEVCRAGGLDVAEADALSYLSSLPDASLGGLLAAQVVEHLEPSYLLRFLDQAQRVLQPGSPIVLETINVACWLAFFQSYIRDLTHARPLHPDTLRYLVTASGFVEAEVRFAAAVEPANRLQPTPHAARHQGGEAMIALADAFDTNVERLNSLMFTHLDYAVIAKRP
jgi:SAM-dependent methyltransferase